MALNRGHDLAAQIAGRRGEPKALVDDEQRAAELLQAVGFERRRVRCQRSPRDMGKRFADRAQAPERDLRPSRPRRRFDGSPEATRSVGLLRAGVEDAALSCVANSPTVHAQCRRRDMGVAGPRTQALVFDSGDHDLPTRPTRDPWLWCPPPRRIGWRDLGIGSLFVDRGIDLLAGLLPVSLCSHEVLRFVG
jgi:hypothetical protein